MNRAFMSALLIMSLVTALVSPACAFVNGSIDFIEICNSAGDVEVIAVADNAGAPSSGTHKVQPDCAFCFASSQAKAIGPQDIQLLKLSSSYTKISNGVFAPLSLAVKTYQPRAPPLYRS